MSIRSHSMMASFSPLLTLDLLDICTFLSYCVYDTHIRKPKSHYVKS